MAHVEWLESASNDLADCWMRATPSERQTIAAASNNIDYILSRNPLEGESRSGALRIAFFGPLLVYFKVEKEGQVVTVAHIRLRRRRS